MRNRRQIKENTAIENVKAILYCRVSSEKQKASGLGIEDQERQLLAWAKDQGITDVVVLKDEAESGKGTDRPSYVKALALLSSGDRNLIAVVKLDRLARNTREVHILQDRVQSENWNIAVLEGTVKFDTRSANGKLILNIFAAVAEWESDMASERTRDAYASKRQRSTDEGLIAPEVEERIVKLIRENKGLRGTAELLNAEGVPTAKGGTWYASTVSRVVKRYEAKLTG